MHLGKITKINMILAILLCMAFVVSFGSTLAAGQYNFKGQSINNVNGEQIENNVYTNYEYAQGAQGKYVYRTGTYNNLLSISYGFRENYDLMIRFTATYTNENHKAKDFSLNFANRDMWLVDIGSTNGLKINNGNTVEDLTQTYYDLTSNSNTITGVMYYMGKITGSGTLPVISGVNFYTSPNNSYSYIGDILTITLTPEYVVSGEYGDNHQFNVSKNGFEPNEDIFGGWVSFMNESAKTAENAQYYIYNGYVYSESNDRSLKYPKDSTVIKNDGSGLVNPNATSPTYANTAYRYTVSNGRRSYEALTAGNKYYGGLGVYVIPNSSATANKLITVGITIRYVWQKDGQIAGFSPSGIVSFKTSNDITTITKNGTSYHYYKSQITEPTYINVLDYIMLTAENYETIIKGGYSLILNYISVSLETNTASMAVGDSGERWTSQSREAYTLNNSTNNSQLLARVADIMGAEKSYEADLSITNNSTSVLNVSSFSVKGYLWYSAYTTTDEDNGDGETNLVEHFVEMPLGELDKSKSYLRPTYLTDLDASANVLSAEDIWEYDSTMWNVSFADNTYTFTYIAGVAYIPSGSTLTLIKGVTIPQTTICQDATTANDFWCNIEVVGVNVQQGAPTYASITSTNGIETIVEGYYSVMSASNPGKIYIRNNTNQEITKLALSNNVDENMPIVYSLVSGSAMPRDSLVSILPSSAVTITNHLNVVENNSLVADAISIKPNETVLAYTITPNQNAIIYDYKITATLNAVEYDSDIKLVYNVETNRGEIINNSSKFYEFRLTSATRLTDLINADDFVEKYVDDKYYYYYKGIICPNQCMAIIDGEFAINISIGNSDKVEHNDAWDVSHYVSTNYVIWGLEDGDEWLTAMKAPFIEPTTDERQNAIKVN